MLNNKIFYLYETNVINENEKMSQRLCSDVTLLAIRCYIDDVHYFDLSLYDAPVEMDWYDAKLWCEENYCRLPMKHECLFIADNIDKINKMLINVVKKGLEGTYWSSSETGANSAWVLRPCVGASRGGLGNIYGKGFSVYVRPVLAL